MLDMIATPFTTVRLGEVMNSAATQEMTMNAFGFFSKIRGRNIPHYWNPLEKRFYGSVLLCPSCESCISNNNILETLFLKCLCNQI